MKGYSITLAMMRLMLLSLMVTWAQFGLGFVVRGPVQHSFPHTDGRRTYSSPSTSRHHASALKRMKAWNLESCTRQQRSRFPLQSAASDGSALVVKKEGVAPLAVIPKQPAGGPSPVVSGASLSAIVIADILLNRAFLRAGLKFPSSLAGMMGLFAGLVTLERFAPSAAEKSVSLLEPGSALLARWLPVFFVPTLVILPLSPAPSKANALRLIFIVFGGWFVSLASTAAVVRTLSPPEIEGEKGASSVTSNPKAPPVFGAPMIRLLGLGAVAAGATAVLSPLAPARLSCLTAEGAVKSAKVLSLLMATLFGFAAGTRLPRKVTKALHPVVTCTAVAMGSAAVIGRGCGLSFADMLRSYVTKSRCPVHLGAGDLLLGLLGPSVLSFAVQMYRRRGLIFKNAKQVAGGTIFCATSGLFGTALASRLLGLPETLRLTVLSRNITSPLAMAICSLLGADISLAVAIVVITGLVGANFGATTLDALGVKDPAARGLAQGGSAHGLGTAAMVNEPTAFAFSAVAMALTATASTVLVSIPVVRIALLRVALGAATGVPAIP